MPKEAQASTPINILGFLKGLNLGWGLTNLVEELGVSTIVFKVVVLVKGREAVCM